MNNKTTFNILVGITAASLVLAAYLYFQTDSIKSETNEWKAKYEEALIDMEEANKRIELMKEDLEKALKDSEEHRLKAEQALEELQKHKRK